MVALKKPQPSRMTYQDAGVDIRSADDFIKEITPIADATAKGRTGAMEGIGGFGALFDLKKTGYVDPILVSSTDGVGTKLRIAIDTNCVETIGIDLVAMCVNDVLVHGAEPLFFLNYFALGELNRSLGKRVLEGIAEGCRLAGAALVGGETAEMPGFYSSGDFDLAGFTVGVVERGRVLPRRGDIKAGDVLLGIASSGVHSNGYSLVRRLVENSHLRWSDRAPFSENESLGAAFLEPTKIYVKSVLHALKNSSGIKALAHITGSGAVGKLHRILPARSKTGVRARIQLGSWKVPPIFKWLNDRAGYSKTPTDQRELLRAFNCGIGMVAIVGSEHVRDVQQSLQDVGENVYEIGEIENHSYATSDPEEAVELDGYLNFEELPKGLLRKTR